MIDLPKMRAEHVPNTPRTHDAQGHRVDEAPQCRKDLQTWPCETRQLIDLLDLADERDVR